MKYGLRGCQASYSFWTWIFRFVHHIKGGCAHFDMCNIYSKLIDLDPQDIFFTILPQADFLFSLLGQTQVCDTGDDAVMNV